ncbi:MAG TPA: radical SAM protein [Bryobacteraceae bacterium]|nr:radical SAM protein [Bryobacteraceae bacterium]
MRSFNRAKILWSYLARKERVNGLPVEYIVETTAKCNLYCPMCPRETHKQPKEDMTDQIFERLVQGSAATGEHMMLIGLGEPFMDRKIFDRIEYCERHGIATLLSTNGTFLDEKMSAKLLESPLAHITLSFDGASKETYEYYRKGARFEKVRENFVRFARMKHARKSKIQVVVQMVRMPGNAHEADEFRRFWSGVEGVDQVRVKEDETDVLEKKELEPARKAGTDVAAGRRCHYLWRGPMYVKHDGRVFPCCQSYMLDGAPVGDLREQTLEEIFNSEEMRYLRRMHAAGRGSGVDMCSRCRTSIPHPLLAAGSLALNGKWVRRAMPAVERLIRGGKLPSQLLSQRTELVQIQAGPDSEGVNKV